VNVCDGNEEENMITIAALLSSVATLIVAMAALYLIIRLIQLVDVLSDQIKKP
jgi:hypothetical protein